MHHHCYSFHCAVNTLRECLSDSLDTPSTTADMLGAYAVLLLLTVMR